MWDIRFKVNCLICECLWNNVPLFVPTFSHIRERNKDWYATSSHNKWEDTDTSLFCFQLLQCRIINTSKATNNFYTHVNNEWKGEELGVSQVGQESSFVYVSEPHWGTFLIVENVHSGSARTVLSFELPMLKFALEISLTQPINSYVLKGDEAILLKPPTF